MNFSARRFEQIGAASIRNTLDYTPWILREETLGIGKNGYGEGERRGAKGRREAGNQRKERGTGSNSKNARYALILPTGGLFSAAPRPCKLSSINISSMPGVPEFQPWCVNQVYLWAYLFSLSLSFSLCSFDGWIVQPFRFLSLRRIQLPLGSKNNF